MINNKMGDSKIRDFLNRKIRSRRDRYNSERK